MQRFEFSIPLFCLAFILCDSAAIAQPPGGRGAPGLQGGRGQGGPAGGGRPGTAGEQQAGQQPPWLAIFDTDRNGELSAAEIKNATASLMKLDRNNDGKIAGDELRFGGAPGPAGMGQQGLANAGAGETGGRGQPGGGGRTGARGPGAGGAPGGGGQRGGDPAQADAAFAAQVKTLDANGDGLIALDELPEHMHEAFEIADADKNGSLNEAELLVLASQFRRNKLNPDGGEPVNAPSQGRPQGGGQEAGGGGQGQRPADRSR